MGQGQSSAQPGPGSSDNGRAKKDYYELLEVEQNASSEEIKKAYRKKALELHPDRNFGNVEAATNLFAEIQSAYEVLSDPQERSWYDSHRDVFLGGDDGCETSAYSYNARMTTSADIIKLFSKFSPRMEFSDSPNGFYGGLRETFTQLALEEEAACHWEGVEILQYPSFGSRDDASHAVRDFYAAWGSFSTKKSFAWKDVYRYSEAPDRRVRRMMEKENKRLRDGAIREFNEAVRSLVSFAKKRDPRYQAYKDGLSETREALRRSAANQASRSRAANQANLRDHVLQDWARSDGNEQYMEESSEEGEEEHFECIACHKTFKSQNQYQAHERSKKHIKAVKQLRWEMKMQHDELDLGHEAVQPTEDGSNEAVHTLSPISEEAGGNCNEVKEQGNTKPSINANTAAESDRDLEIDASPIGDGQSDNESDYAPRDILEHRLTGQDSLTKAPVDELDELAAKISASSLNDGLPLASVKLGKAKQKRAKKAQLGLEKSQTRCTICNASFASRNKLFTHIKTHGEC